MENRLLSEQEISKALTVSAEFVSENAWSFGPLTAAQDAKTTAVLIALIEQRFGDGHDRPYIQIGVQDWQDFKQSLEVKQ